MSRSPIVSTPALQAMLAGPKPPRLLDVRWHLGGPDGRPEYAAGHLPGAVYVDLETVFSGPATGSGGRHPLPEISALQQGLREAGVSVDRPIVCYDAGDGLAAGRAWWMLRWAGHPEVYVLDGGWSAWTGETSDEPVSVEPSDFVVRPGGMPLVDADGAAAAARDGVLMDVRAHNRYTGEFEPLDPVAGHIPGAVNVPGQDDYTADGLLREPAELAKRYTRAGVDGSAPVAVSCGSGITAARTILAIHAAGLADTAPALYAGSFSDWISEPSRPVATGD
ncbi:sulfurtransferase [Fodinicola acaciae]|uniref:sulfurtransferase n=1 Tax=Fodinicola acaciae TaxID=2681555 RepID=UPI0013D582DF|nr:sulfurtransferase [Fodinicola acaciae]